MILFRHGVAPPTLPLHGINEGWEKCVAFLGNAAAIYWLRTMWGNVPVIEKAWIKSMAHMYPASWLTVKENSISATRSESLVGKMDALIP